RFHRAPLTCGRSGVAPAPPPIPRVVPLARLTGAVPREPGRAAVTRPTVTFVPPENVLPVEVRVWVPVPTLTSEPVPVMSAPALLAALPLPTVRLLAPSARVPPAPVNCAALVAPPRFTVPAFTVSVPMAAR